MTRERPCRDAPCSGLTLRDRLAASRTILANERTVLAYVRTALSLVAAGAFFIKFLKSVESIALGWGLIAAGVALFAIGFVRYHRMKQYITGATQNVLEGGQADRSTKQSN